MTDIHIPKADPAQHDPAHFEKAELTIENVGSDPFDLFARWYSEAQETEISDPNAMALATATIDGWPNVRTLLLKEFSEQGFVIYSNYDSQKGQEIDANPKVALCFHWKTQLRQIRIQGIIGKIAAAQSDAYFASRHKSSRVGAWVSRQSHEVSGRAEMLEKLSYYEKYYAESEDIPRPDYWGGYLIEPLRIEFWQNGAFRLHDRLVFMRNDVKDNWETKKLYP